MKAFLKAFQTHKNIPFQAIVFKDDELFQSLRHTTYFNCRIVFHAWIVSGAKKYSTSGSFFHTTVKNCSRHAPHIALENRFSCMNCFRHAKIFHSAIVFQKAMNCSRRTKKRKIDDEVTVKQASKQANNLLKKRKQAWSFFCNNVGLFEGVSLKY